MGRRREWEGHTCEFFLASPALHVIIFFSAPFSRVLGLISPSMLQNKACLLAFPSPRGFNSSVPNQRDQSPHSSPSGLKIQITHRKSLGDRPLLLLQSQSPYWNLRAQHHLSPADRPASPQAPCSLPVTGGHTCLLQFPRMTWCFPSQGLCQNIFPVPCSRSFRS